MGARRQGAGRPPFTGVGRSCSFVCSFGRMSRGAGRAEVFRLFAATSRAVKQRRRQGAAFDGDRK